MRLGHGHRFDTLPTLTGHAVVFDRLNHVEYDELDAMAAEEFAAELNELIEGVYSPAKQNFMLRLLEQARTELSNPDPSELSLPARGMRLA